MADRGTEVWVVEESDAGLETEAVDDSDDDDLCLLLMWLISFSGIHYRVDVMISAIVTLYNIAWWLLGAMALLPLGLVIARIVWRGKDDSERETAMLAALVLAPFSFAGLIWLGTWWGMLAASPGNVRCVAALFALFSIPFLKNALPTWPRFLRVLGVGALVFIGWTAFRIFSPEIVWGEKPMDFSFLNYLTRCESLPPDDPWAAGHPLNYYYFGHYTWAIFHKFVGIDSAYGFNLALSSIGTGLVLAVWCLLRTVHVRERLALFGAIFVAVGSNLEWVRLCLKGFPALGFDHFWATSRLLTSPAITEYPSWSVMFGDLHAHLIGLPLSVLCYGAIFKLLVADKAALEVRSGAWAVLGFLEALLYATNSWELIPHGGMLVLCTIAAMFIPHATSFVSRIGALSANYFCLALGAFVFTGPWLDGLGERVRIEYWWVVQDYATAWQVARHFGQFLIPLLAAVVIGLISWPGQRFHIWILALSAALVPIGLGIYVAQFGHATPPFGFLAGCGVLVFVGVSKILLGRDVSLGVLLSGAGMLIGLSELVYVMDHTNTVFKLYLSIWIWLGVAATIAIERLWNAQRGRWVRWPVAVAVLTSLIGSAVNIYGLVTFHRVPGPRPTLNGMLYLPSLSSAEAELMYWMRRNIAGVPVVVEAIGDSYREFGRIAMNTGLPAVMGWDYHLSQRGVDYPDRHQRIQAVHEIYGAERVEDILPALHQYRVQYVVIGEVERRQMHEGRYSEKALRKFAESPQLFRKVFSAGSVELYAVRLQ